MRENQYEWRCVTNLFNYEMIYILPGRLIHIISDIAVISDSYYITVILIRDDI